LAAMAVVSVAAVAQTTGSPFAKKTKKQAWETDAVRPGPQGSGYEAPTYQPPNYQAPSYQPPTSALRSSSVPKYIPPPNYNPPPQNSPEPAAANAPSAPPSVSYSAPSYQNSTAAPASNYAPPSASYPSQTGQSPFASQPSAPQEDKGGFSVPAVSPRGNARGQRPPAYQQANNQPQAYGGPYGAPTGPRAQTAQNYPQKGYGPQSWKDRLGLGNLLTSFKAVLKVGAAAVQRKNTAEDAGWNAGFIADGKVSGEVSAITQGGMEYGIGGEIRGQYDKYRRGFGGRVGDCGTDSLAAIAGCNSLTVEGLTQPLRGHSSQFYSLIHP